MCIIGSPLQSLKAQLIDVWGERNVSTVTAFSTFLT